MSHHHSPPGLPHHYSNIEVQTRFLMDMLTRQLEANDTDWAHCHHARAYLIEPRRDYRVSCESGANTSRSSKESGARIRSEHRNHVRRALDRNRPDLRRQIAPRHESCLTRRGACDVISGIWFDLPITMRLRLRASG